MSPIARPGRRYRLVSGVAVVALVTVGIGLAGRPAQAQVGTPDRVGQWTVSFTEPGVESPPVAEAMAVLPDGRVLYLDGGDDPSPADRPDRGAGVLDLRGGAPAFERPADDPSGTPRSSADLVSLSDGRLLIGTGGSGPGQAPGATTLFDPRPSSFHPAGSMAHAHRRASLVTLSDGQVLVAGGSGESLAPTPFLRPLPAETFDPRRGSWDHNPGAAATLPPEPRLHLMSNGEVFYDGVGRDAPELGSVSEELLARERFFDPGTSTWRMAGLAPYGPRDGSLSVLLPIDPPFDQSTLLTAGGSLGRTGAGSPAVALATLTTVDRSGNIAHSRTGDLRDPRWLSSAVALPDGSVLALGGSGGGPGTADEGFAVPSAELYDPAAGGWRGMTSPSEARPSRHSAVLLADGRVLFGGPSQVMKGGASFEVFSPPYLFRGRRPSLRRAPAGVAWDEPFKVLTPDAGDIEAVVITRLPSPQHGADSDGRTLRLDFSRTGSGELTVHAPPNGVAAPPGYYYLFVVRGSLAGPIPSVARIVHLAATADPGDAPRPFPDNAPAPAPPAGEGEPGSGPGAFSGRVRG